MVGIIKMEKGMFADPSILNMSGAPGMQFFQPMNNYSKYAFYMDFLSSTPTKNKAVDGGYLATAIPGIRYLNDGTPVAENVPAIEPGLGLRGVGSNTNMIQDSDDVQTSTWFPVRMVIKSDGKVVDTTEFSSRHIDTAWASAAVDDTLIYSIKIKPAGLNYVTLDSTIGLASNRLVVNLTTGDIEEGVGSAELLSDGYVQIHAIFEIITTAAGSVRIYAHPGAVQRQNYAGDGTSGIYIKNAQLVNSKYPLPYVPTSGTTVSTVTEVSEGVDHEYGNFLRLEADEIGSVYTGSVSEFDFSETFSLGSQWVDNGDGSFTLTGDGTWNPLVLTDATNTDEIGTYRVSFTLSDLTGGSIKLYPQPPLASINEDGSYQFTYSMNQVAKPSGIAIGRATTGVATSVVVSGIKVEKVSRHMGFPALVDALGGVADGAELWSTGIISSGIFIDNGDYSYTVSTPLATSALVTSNPNPDLTDGGYYEFSYIASNTVGDHRAFIGGLGNLQTNTGDGEFTERGYCAGTGSMYIRCEEGFAGTIQVNYVKEVSPAKGELQVEWTPGFDSSIFPAGETTRNTLISVLEHSSDILYGRHTDDTERIQGFDGTNYPYVNVPGTSLTAGRTYCIQAMWDETGVQYKFDGIAGVKSAFDGSWNPGGLLNLFFQNTQLNYIKSIKVLKEPESWA